MALEATQRFSGAPWFNEVQKLTIYNIGLGTIGSWAALNVARLGIQNHCLVDYDTIDAYNLAGQLYPRGLVGALKTDVLLNIIKAFGPPNTLRYIRNEKFMSESLLPSYKGDNNIFISGVDSMAARKEIFLALEKMILFNTAVDNKGILIDGRMSAEGLQIITVDLNNAKQVKKYQEEYLFDDSEANSTEVCSYKQTSFIGSMIGGLITNILVNICTNRALDEEIREVPMVLQYTAEDMVFNMN